LFSIRTTRALNDLDQGIRLDPYYPGIDLHFKAQAYLIAGAQMPVTSLRGSRRLERIVDGLRKAALPQ
jgi:hypothetical protein